MIKALAFLLLLPGILSAQPFPALYDVTGVAGDDVLNIRTEPTASAQLLGTLAPDASGVEVVALSDDKRWGMVNAYDGAGWVSMRFMARNPGQEWGFVPPNLFCSGTEPFWDFDVLEDGQALFRAPDVTRDYTVGAPVMGIAYPGDFAIIAQAPAGRATAFVSQRGCNDGMSDREYGLSAGILFEDPDSRSLYAGCCSLQR